MRDLPECEMMKRSLELKPALTKDQAQKMELLEKSQGWKEGDFDQVLQYTRTALLRRTFD